MNRIYLDANSTSPLSPSVQQMLRSGEVEFFNPASTHHFGQSAKKVIHQSEKFILETLQAKNFRLYFHSGVTESINVLFKGLVLSKAIDTIVVMSSDHSCVLEQECFATEHGVSFIKLAVDNQGQISNFGNLIKEDRILFNLTWVNNETGVVFNKDTISKIKERYPKSLIHVDAAQAIGKIQALSVDSQVDYYTFSGHKFGALKGVGFSLVAKDSPFNNLLEGGEQSKLRSGTQNVLGIKSLELALKDCLQINFNEIEAVKNKISLAFEQNLPGKVIIPEFENQCANTLTLFFPTASSQFLTTFFDLKGVAVSAGSACNSGTIQPSHVISAYGYENYADKVIRISIPFWGYAGDWGRMMSQFASELRI